MTGKKSVVIFVIVTVFMIVLLVVYTIHTFSRKPERIVDDEEYNSYENYKENNEVHEGDVQDYELDKDVNDMIEDIFKRNEENK